MLIYEFQKPETSGRVRKALILSCDNCGTHFEKWAHHRHKNADGCRRKCMDILLGKSSVIKCGFCQKMLCKTSAQLNRSMSGEVYCNTTCSNLGRNKFRKDIPNYNYRGWALSQLPQECSICKFNDIRALEVHHIDRDRTNNSLDNLVILCANCHSIEHK